MSYYGKQMAAHIISHMSADEILSCWNSLQKRKDGHIPVGIDPLHWGSALETEYIKIREKGVRS